MIASVSVQLSTIVTRLHILALMSVQLSTIITRLCIIAHVQLSTIITRLHTIAHISVQLSTIITKLYTIAHMSVQSGPLLSSLRLVHWLESTYVGRLVIWSAKKLYMQFILGYSLVGFCLFTFERYSVVRICMHLV